MSTAWIGRLRGFVRKAFARSSVSAWQEADRLIALGRAAETDGRLGDACSRYRAAAAVAPTYAKAHLNLGVGLEAAGDTDGALRAFQATLAIEPGNAYASYNLGRLHYLRGDLVDAENLLRRALAGRPEFPQANVTLARVCRARGDAGAAIALLESALAQNADDYGALIDFAEVGMELGRLADAESALRRATALQPGEPDGFSLLARLLVEAGQAEQAESLLARAVRELPQAADLFLNLGNVHCAQRRFDEAVTCYETALRLDANLSDGYRNLANVERDQGRHRAALGHYRKALALAPESAPVRWSHALAQIPVVYGDGVDPEDCRQRFAQELGELERWFTPDRVEAGFEAVGVQQPFYLAYQERSNRALLERHGALCERLMGAWFERQGFAPAHARRAGGALRVGVVSKFYHQHSVWNAIVKGWFDGLDRERFALHAFYLGAHQDAETAFARAHAARFVSGARGLRAWVQCILDEQLDVLIYPEIGMDPLTVKLSSLRLAPVQVATWGHPETSGLRTIDHFLSAQAMEPPAAQDEYTENLVLLPHLGCSWREPVAPSPAAGGTAAHADDDAPLVICPGMPFKYAPQHDWVLVEIARRVPKSRLLFFAPRDSRLGEVLQERLRHAFRSAGVDYSAHVSLLSWQSKPQYHSLLRRGTVFLDTIGFSGFNTAMDAVHCGLPVVTREGRFLRGRLAGGILAQLGLRELVVPTETQYVDLAVRICLDADYREHIRRIMIGRAPLLGEDAAPVRALERFLCAVAPTTHRV